MLLRLLASLLQSSRSAVLRRHVLATCRSLARCCSSLEGGEWSVVARQAVTMLSTNLAGAPGHGLVRTLLSRGGDLLQPAQVYSLYRSRLVRQDDASLATLALLLRLHPPREGQEELLAWLLPGEEEGRVAKTAWGEAVRMAEVLGALVTRRLGGEEVEERWGEGVEGDGSISDMEQDLLELALVTNIRFEQVEQKKDQVQCPEPLLLTDLADKVQAALVQEAGEVLERLAQEGGKGVEEAVGVSQAILLYVSQVPGLPGDRLQAVARDLLARAGEATVRLLRPGREASSALARWEEVAGREELPASLMVRLEEVVKEVCHARQREAQPPTQANGNRRATDARPSANGDDMDFDDFENFGDSSSSSHVEEVHDLEVVKEPGAEAADLALLTSCFKLLSSQASLPDPGQGSQSTVSDREDRQLRLVRLLVSVLDCHDLYSSSVLDLVLPPVTTLACSPFLTDGALEELAGLLQRLAAATVSKTKFHQPGVFVLFRLLLVLAPALHRLEAERPRKTYTRIIRGIVKLNHSQAMARLGSSLSVALLKVLGKLALLDASWAVWPEHNMVSVRDSTMDQDTDLDQPLGKSLPRFLAAPSVLQRLSAARELMLLHPYPLLPWLHSTVLPALTCSLPTSLSSSLALLSSLTLPKSALATPLLCCLLQVASQAHHSTLLPRALQLVATNRATELSHLLLASLPSLLASHLSSGLTIETFPHHLLDLPSLPQFLASQEHQVLPILLLQDPTQPRLASLAKLLRRSPQDLVKANLATLARLFLPGMAARDQGLRLEGGEDMNRLGELVEGLLPDVFCKKVGRTFLSTVQHCLGQVHDPQHLAATFSLPQAPDLVPPPPPVLGAKMPLALLQLYDQHFCEEGSSLWQHHATNSPEDVARVVVHLSSALTHPDLGLLPERLRALHCLWLWLEQLEPSFRAPALLPLLPLLAHCTISSLLHLLHSDSQEDLLKAGLVTLHKLTTLLTPVCSSSLHPCLFSIYYCLLGLSSRHPLLSTLACDILDFLFVTHGFRFPSHLRLLEDPPPLAATATLRTALARERPASPAVASAMENWLEVARTTPPAFLATPLEALLARLQELTDQQVDPDLLRRLLAALLEIARGEEEQAATLALRCLGELGPADLDSPLLQVRRGSEHIHLSRRWWSREAAPGSGRWPQRGGTWARSWRASRSCCSARMGR